MLIAAVSRMCGKQMEETAVNFSCQSVQEHIWDRGVPKINLTAFDWCLGSERKCN